MDIKLNSRVECIDGKSGGYVTGLILNPDTKEFTHLVIENDGIALIVPAKLIKEVDLEGIRLNCTVTHLTEQPHFVETEYIPVPVGYYGYFPGSVGYIPSYVMGGYGVQHLQIPKGEFEIQRGMAVFAKDGRVGRVDDVIVDPSNDQITHFIMREGHLWGTKDVVIGIDHIKSIEADVIQLKATKAQVSQFPLIPVNH